MESGGGLWSSLAGAHSGPEDACRSEENSVMGIPGGWECEFGSKHEGLLTPVR